MVMWPEQAARLEQFDALAAENERLRARAAELFAETQRLRAELDAAGRRSVLLCPASAMLGAMEASTEEEPGTIMRATDESGLEYELGSDRQWRRRLSATGAAAGWRSGRSAARTTGPPMIRA